VHDGVEVKQEAVRWVLEEYLTYQEVAERLGMRKAERIERWVGMYPQEGELSFHKRIGRPPKAETEQSELERLRMENVLLKKFHSELRELGRAQRNIGRSTTPKKNSK